MSIKYKFTRTELEEKVKSSRSMGHLLSLVGVIAAGGNYATMKNRLINWNIDCTHWGKTMKERQGWLKGKTHNFSKKTPSSDLFIQNYYGGITTNAIRNRLIKENIFQHKCYNCNLTEWMGRKIALELEHIDGNRRNNLINNLTLLCPNCHALTPTYRGKNKGKNGTREEICTPK